MTQYGKKSPLCTPTIPTAATIIVTIDLKVLKGLLTRFNVKRDNFRAIFHKNLFVALNYIIVNLDISRKKSRNFGPKKKNFKSRERGCGG